MEEKKLYTQEEVDLITGSVYAEAYNAGLNDNGHKPQTGVTLPANDAVQNWFEENIDKECSASSAVYKFRLWLESLQVTRHTGARWVKAADFDMSKGGMLFYRFDGPTLKSIGIGHFVGDVFHGTNLDVFPKPDWKYLYVLDESGTPAAAREEDAVEFAEWVSINNYQWHVAGQWTLNGRRAGTTTELYRLFKQQKENP